jgi:hypothetical protein
MYATQYIICFSPFLPGVRYIVVVTDRDVRKTVVSVVFAAKMIQETLLHGSMSDVDGSGLAGDVVDAYN